MAPIPVKCIKITLFILPYITWDCMERFYKKFKFYLGFFLNLEIKT